MVTDLAGGFAHLRLEGDRAEVLSRGQEQVYIDGAAGLVGVAIDPDFDQNRYFYMSMSLTKENVAIRRYTLDDADPEATLGSMVTILQIDTPGAPRWHNITSIGFEDDGVMWALVGDKGMFDPAQDIEDRLGSLIRILPSKDEGVGGYTTPEEPGLFAPGADPAIYTKGIRSPWKGVLHDGRWYFGDVGLDSIEEINIIDGPRENFGWPLVEGPCDLEVSPDTPADCVERFRDPWVYYDRSNSHPFIVDDLDAVPTNQRSVYAGWIYEPRADDPYEGKWNDTLVFGDTYVGFIRAKRIDGQSEDFPVGHLQWASAWAQGPDGHVYIAALADFPPPERGPPGPSPILRAVLAE